MAALPFLKKKKKKKKKINGLVSLISEFPAYFLVPCCVSHLQLMDKINFFLLVCHLLSTHIIYAGHKITFFEIFWMWFAISSEPQVDK
jgi:hypothetical protein